MNYLSVYENCHRRVMPHMTKTPCLRVGVMCWLKQCCPSPACACGENRCSPERPTGNRGRCLCYHKNSIQNTLHSSGCWRARQHSRGCLGAPRCLLPADAARFSQPTADPCESHGAEGASSSRGCWKPGITKPGSGLPSGENACYTLLETMT